MGLHNFGMEGPGMHRRRLFSLSLGAAALGTLPRSALALSAEPERAEITVYRSPTCGCCIAWAEHLQRAGFGVEVIDVNQNQLYALKARLGLTVELASCHTAILGDYFIEGHVPAGDIARLLEERPAAAGLTVPSMPIGSPGMEMGDEKEAFDTLLVLEDGSTEIFEHHPGTEA